MRTLFQHKGTKGQGVKDSKWEELFPSIFAPLTLCPFVLKKFEELK